MLARVRSIQLIHGNDGSLLDAIAKSPNTAGLCKKEQIFGLVALILFPQSVREAVQVYVEPTASWIRFCHDDYADPWRVQMKIYYHALPQIVVGPPNSHHVGEFQDSFDWVSDLNEASRGSLDCVEATQRKLEQRHSLETTLVAVKDEKLMTPMYVISLVKPEVE